MRERAGNTPLSTAGFTRQYLHAAERQHVASTFGSHVWLEASLRRWIATGTERLVDRVDEIIGDGKEATVYRCRMQSHIGFPHAVAKVYRAQKFRAFSNASRYVDTGKLRDRRSRRAVEKKTRRGRDIAHRTWTLREWETMKLLYDAGADVPEPYAQSGDAILMEYIGDDDGPAPLLRKVRLDAEVAREAFEALIRNVTVFLACDRIHADLSAYNVLWWRGRVVVIDLPQAVEADSPKARVLLYRDIHNLCSHFARMGVVEDPERIADDLWRRRMRGDL